MFSLKKFLAENKQSLKEFYNSAYKYLMYIYMWTSPLLVFFFAKGSVRNLYEIPFTCYCVSVICFMLSKIIKIDKEEEK